MHTGESYAIPIRSLGLLVMMSECAQSLRDPLILLLWLNVPTDHELQCQLEAVQRKKEVMASVEMRLFEGKMQQTD